MLLGYPFGVAGGVAGTAADDLGFLRIIVGDPISNHASLKGETES